VRRWFSLGSLGKLVVLDRPCRGITPCVACVEVKEQGWSSGLGWLCILDGLRVYLLSHIHYPSNSKIFVVEEVGSTEDSGGGAFKMKVMI